jgi:glycosyltransferase involved in cell wall biosynthesis
MIGNDDQLQDLTVVMKTMLRYEFANECIAEIRKIDSDLKIIVIDDTPYEYREFLKYMDDNIIHVLTNEDVGVSTGRNVGAEVANSEYLWYLDDSQCPSMSREELIENLNYIKSNFCDLVGSKSANIETAPDGRIACVNFKINKFQKVDIVDNFFIAKRSFILANLFPAKCKIGGEHFAWFYKLRQNDKIVYSSPTMKFLENGDKINVKNKEIYRKYRNRSFRKEALEGLGVEKFYWTYESPNNIDHANT